MPPAPDTSIRLHISPKSVRLVDAPGIRGNDAAPNSGPHPPRTSLERAAHERGRQEAEAELREQLIEQRTQLATLTQGVLRSLERSVTQTVQQSETLLITLAFEVAQKLVAELPFTSERVAASIREALQEVEGNTEIVVELNPEDLALVEALAPASRPGAERPQSIRFLPASAMRRGDCIVRTRFGVIHNEHDTKVRNLKEALHA